MTNVGQPPRLPDGLVEAASRLLKKALPGADPARRLIGSPGWQAPNLCSANGEEIDGNILLWDNIKPNIVFRGTGNLVVFRETRHGRLYGALNGSQNVCYIGGQADVVILRSDITGSGNVIYVGSRTKIVSAHAVLAAADASASILIGERSMLSSQVSLRTTDSHGIIDLATDTVVNPPSSIIIEPHVWIGEKASVLKGCQIGAGSIIGAASLVTSALPSRAICAGIPAKVIRSGSSWTNKPNPSAANIAEMKTFLDAVSPRSAITGGEIH